jgi:phytoene dehydrogenase-like protein
LYDAIVIGAGIGGLTCATKLAKSGNKVLLLEKIHHVGGTSHIFRRGVYYFPMGGLSFSSPDTVLELLGDIGIQENIEFSRNHFQLITPNFDIIYSQPFQELRETLKEIFEDEKYGIDAFFTEMNEIMNVLSTIQQWHPEYLIGKKKEYALENLSPTHKKDIELLERYSQIPAKQTLEKYISNEILQNFLGSQGTYVPKMSMTLLAIMWCLMSDKGIWFPSCGIHGINDLVYDTFLSFNGEAKLRTPVKKIMIENNNAIGVKTSKDEIFKADWIISNADYKKTFLELIDPQDIPEQHLNTIKNVSYFGSELCVYLGVNPEKIDLSKVKAQHVFYRKETKSSKHSDLEDFDNREIEICIWSKNYPDSAPSKKATILLRVGFPYDHFSNWKISEKRRKEGYREYKKRLAEKLIKTAENVVPGLSSSIEVMDIATPLTYEDWGQRFRGSIAGWSWRVEGPQKLPGKLLIETPIDNLLMVGMYAASELFLGGYPTAMYTGSLAADLVLEKSSTSKTN